MCPDDRNLLNTPQAEEKLSPVTYETRENEGKEEAEYGLFTSFGQRNAVITSSEPSSGSGTDIRHCPSLGGGHRDVLDVGDDVSFGVRWQFCQRMFVLQQPCIHTGPEAAMRHRQARSNDNGPLPSHLQNASHNSRIAMKVFFPGRVTQNQSCHVFAVCEIRDTRL